MKRNRIGKAGVLAPALLVGVVAGASLAQDTPDERDTKKESQPDSRDKEWEGREKHAQAGVWLITTDDAIGKNVMGLSDDKLGDINNLIISRDHGRVMYALVGRGGVAGIGEKVIAVPYPALRWNPQKKNYTLPVAEERMKNAPALGADEWRTLSESALKDSSCEYFNCPDLEEQTAADREFEKEYESDLRPTDWPLLRASDIKGEKLINNEGQEIGKVDEIVYDTQSGRVAFAVVSFGGVFGVGSDKVPVPWSMFDVNQEGKLFAKNLDKEAIKSAPRLTKADWAELQDRDFPKRVYTHFGRRAMWLEEASSQPRDLSGTSIDEYNRRYTSGENRTVKGTVTSVEEKEPVSDAAKIVCVRVRGDDGRAYVIHTAPRAFLDDHKVTFKSGDEVSVRGRWIEGSGEPYLIATEVTPREGEVLVLRRNDGTTIWIWR